MRSPMSPLNWIKLPSSRKPVSVSSATQTRKFIPRVVDLEDRTLLASTASIVGPIAGTISVPRAHEMFLLDAVPPDVIVQNNQLLLDFRMVADTGQTIDPGRIRLLQSATGGIRKELAFKGNVVPGDVSSFLL